MLKKLPIGLQTFSELIEKNYVYIDKTKYAYDLINRGKVYFLSRPRRFGKSLFVSTLKSIFEARKELFKNLYIANTDYDWQEYPIINLDMGGCSDKARPEHFYPILIKKIKSIAKNYDIQINEEKINNLPDLFEELIIALKEKFNQKVVILIDEYDKPILDQIHNIEIATKNRDILASFYNIIKVQDENIHFVFLTGVTKFSKISLFSGMNNPDDITMQNNYSALLGYTQEELENYFTDYIDQLCKEVKMPKKKTLAKIKKFYNGYNFSNKATPVYNPFSVLSLFSSLDFSNFWYDTGTPRFLIDLIKNNEYNVAELENAKMTKFSNSNFDIDNIELYTLLYQTGYLTIKDYSEQFQTYYLKYPNYEVEMSFTQSLLSLFFADNKKTKVNNDITELVLAMQDHDWEKFFDIISSIFESISHHVKPGKNATAQNFEFHYSALFYLILKNIGNYCAAEVSTNKGRIDASVFIEKNIYIFEFKLNGTKIEAMEQIKNNGYADSYNKHTHKITLIGAQFDSESRSIKEDGYLIEELF